MAKIVPVIEIEVIESTHNPLYNLLNLILIDSFVIYVYCHILFCNIVNIFLLCKSLYPDFDVGVSKVFKTLSSYFHLDSITNDQINDIAEHCINNCTG